MSKSHHYYIVIAALGTQGTAKYNVILVHRDTRTGSQLQHCLDNLWAWDVRGMCGYDADGPCVFIEYDAT